MHTRHGKTGHPLCCQHLLYIRGDHASPLFPPAAEWLCSYYYSSAAFVWWSPTFPPKPSKDSVFEFIYKSYLRANNWCTREHDKTFYTPMHYFPPRALSCHRLAALARKTVKCNRNFCAHLRIHLSKRFTLQSLQHRSAIKEKSLDLWRRDTNRKYFRISKSTKVSAFADKQPSCPEPLTYCMELSNLRCFPPDN